MCWIYHKDQSFHVAILFPFYFILEYSQLVGFSDGSVVKNPPANGGDVGSIPRLGRSPGEGNGNLLQYSCLENPMDGGAWWATVHGVAKSRTRLSDFTHKVNPIIVLECLLGIFWSKRKQFSSEIAFLYSLCLSILTVNFEMTMNRWLSPQHPEHSMNFLMCEKWINRVLTKTSNPVTMSNLQ